MHRKATQLMIKELQEKEAYYNLPFYMKFLYAFTKKKRRFAYLIFLYLIYHYDAINRTQKWMIKKRASSISKFEKRWTLRFSPDDYQYKTAAMNLLRPQNVVVPIPEKDAPKGEVPKVSPFAITPENYAKIGDVFLKVERMLLYGVSRQLIINW